MSLRLIFMGTPEFSVPTLKALAGAGHDIAAVYTQPPRPAGRRGLDVRKTPVHEAAEELTLPVRTPVSLKSEEEHKTFADLDADAAVVVAYGLLLPGAILEGTRLGAFNGHASLLPRWRGAAPIQRAIMAGDSETGMMIMKMDEGLDTGDIAMTRKLPIGPDITAGDLHDQLSTLCAKMMPDAMQRLEAGEIELTAQADDGATYAKKLSKEETRIDWNLPAREVHDRIRGLSPFPGAWCDMTRDGGKSERLKLLRSARAEGDGRPGELLDDRLTVACVDGAIRILSLQKAGSRAMTADAFLAGVRLPRGAFLA